MDGRAAGRTCDWHDWSDGFDFGHEAARQDLAAAFAVAEGLPAGRFREVFLEQVTSEDNWQDRAPAGRWIGMLRVSGEGTAWVREALEALQSRPDYATLGVADLLNALIAAGHRIHVMYIRGHWLDLNNVHDLQHANDFARYRESQDT